jgi:hypothetical protein
MGAFIQLARIESRLAHGSGRDKNATVARDDVGRSSSFVRSTKTPLSRGLLGAVLARTCCFTRLRRAGIAESPRTISPRRKAVVGLEPRVGMVPVCRERHPSP